MRREQRGPQIFLSRTHPEFMSRLFGQEVPEIYDGVVEVVSVARDPGSRAKIAVRSKDGSIDPVGACVGMRGSRVQAVVNELQGEKIDIIPWSADVANFVVNALAPAEVTKVVLDEEAERIEVVVPDEQLSLAIGRRGQNVRLASQLTGWDIDIMTEAEESERRQKEFAAAHPALHRGARCRRDAGAASGLGRLRHGRGNRLCRCARTSRRSRASTSRRREEMQTRAREYLDRSPAELDAKRKELGVADELAEVEGVTPAMLVALGEAEHQDGRGPGRLRHRRSDRLDRAQGRARRSKHKGAFSDLDVSAAEAEAIDHGGARQGGLDRGARREPDSAEEAGAEAQDA